MTPHTYHILETDTQTDMLLREPRSAICVQRFDDSLNSAIHTTYRTWLRSSSMHEPRDPPLKVFSKFDCQTFRLSLFLHWFAIVCENKKKVGAARTSVLVISVLPGRPPTFRTRSRCDQVLGLAWTTIGNDPSAGSPTETLLRLLLPLNDQV